MLRPENVDRATQHVAQQMESDVPLTMEIDVRHASGQWRTLEVVTSRYEFEGETQIIAKSRDVTDRNALARSLEQANRVSGLGRLATTLAHEINNVLMGIQPFAEVIRRKAQGNADLERAGDQITRSIRRSKAVTSKILRFTRPVEPQLVSRVNSFAGSSPSYALLAETVALTLSAQPDV